eukprot:3085713-Prymnesium_polylepis.1
MLAPQLSPPAPSARIAQLLSRVQQELSPAAPTAAVSWPAAMQKEEANGKFSHAVFKLKDGSLRFAHAPAVRGSAALDLVLNKKGSTVSKSYVSATGFDDE